MNLQGDRYHPDIHERGIQTTWYAKRDSVRQRHKIYFQFLEITDGWFGDQIVV
jgi:hypothetical protein